jgi:type VI secretion system protein ImpM
MTGPGAYGKLPAHGDFVRRGLPGSFVAPWDAWLQATVGTAIERLGPDFSARWDSLGAWHFRLPPGCCGPDGVAGVVLPSSDLVGRAFPLTIAVLSVGEARPSPAWHEEAAAAGASARDRGDSIDVLLQRLPAPRRGEDGQDAGWWQAGGTACTLTGLPDPGLLAAVMGAAA